MNLSESKDTANVAVLQEAIAQDAKRLSLHSFATTPHELLIENLLNQIEKVNFRKLAGFKHGDDTKKLRKQHFLICIVDEIIRLSKEKKWNFCRRYGFFYSYNGAFWKSIDRDEVRYFLKQAAERMGIDRFNAQHYEFADQLLKQFNDTAYLPAPATERNKVKINLLNGTFEISVSGRQLRKPSPDDFLTHQLPFAYDPQATAPKFMSFLNRVLPDESSQAVLSEYVGSLFIPAQCDLKLEKALILYGSGANGKSVFFEIVIALLGNDNVSNYSLQNLTSEPAYGRAHLANKLLNYASEINGKLEASTFKQLVSREPITARLPYGQPFTMYDYARLMFNCNELPGEVEHTNAFFRRFLILPFLETIPEKEQDKELAAKIIRAELSGIFNWVLAGLNRLLAKKDFTDCQAAQQQLDLYKKQSDSVRMFLDEQNYQGHTDLYTLIGEVYREYRGFCIEDGLKPVGKPNFRKRLEVNGIHTEKRNVGNVAYLTRTGF